MGSLTGINYTTVMMGWPELFGIVVVVFVLFSRGRSAGVEVPHFLSRGGRDAIGSQILLLALAGVCVLYLLDAAIRWVQG